MVFLSTCVDGDSERFSDMLRMTQLESGEAETKAEVVCLCVHCLIDALLTFRVPGIQSLRSSTNYMRVSLAWGWGKRSLVGLPETCQAEVLHTQLFSLTHTDKSWIKCDKDKYLNTLTLKKKRKFLGAKNKRRNKDKSVSGKHEQMARVPGGSQQGH